MKSFALFLISNCLLAGCLTPAAIALPAKESNSGDPLDIPAETIEDSPVLQEWLEEIPDVLEEIKYDPSFRTRLRLGFTTFPSSDDASGLDIAVKDIFIKHSGLTLSADYQTAFNGDRNAAGLDLHYFVFPLGSYVNFAPQIGYRYVQSNKFSTNGVRLGVRLILALSRTGGGDISVSQSVVNLGGSKEVGITSLSVGYALTPNFRLSGDIERQNSVEDADSRFGLNLEWLL